MPDYGPECAGATVNAAGNSIFGISLPFIGTLCASLCTASQVKRGDKYRDDTRALLKKHFQDFHPGTKVEIRNHLLSLEKTKKRVDRTSWWIQKQATKYREEAEALFNMVDDLSSHVETKTLLRQNNMSCETIASVIGPEIPDVIPLKSIKPTNRTRTPAPSIPEARANAKPVSESIPSTSQRLLPNRLGTQDPTVPTLISDQAGLPSRPEAARIRAVATITPAANGNASDESLGLRGLFPTSSRGREDVQ
ncbi:uncharacterized protein STEHIDRAFT_109781 [Stereum hirsutum FP-91666 SS1]|uniref:uncharacterized protein n=1 Tax=Stereum hirsutum (strain FP-91666) TaxID=721885 RepID=UPI000440FBFE|nr:uncharacterized protein STEHIDRAFT_109781 [Stereum hirsutum FP-91666 SS1]EIM87923.1 hypothetical protein STEHIDRAFT_109781 [Stereum hirsutum FP-91666 SS1]